MPTSKEAGRAALSPCGGHGILPTGTRCHLARAKTLALEQAWCEELRPGRDEEFYCRRRSKTPKAQSRRGIPAPKHDPSQEVWMTANPNGEDLKPSGMACKQIVGQHVPSHDKHEDHTDPALKQLNGMEEKRTTDPSTHHPQTENVWAPFAQDDRADLMQNFRAESIRGAASSILTMSLSLSGCCLLLSRAYGVRGFRSGRAGHMERAAADRALPCRRGHFASALCAEDRRWGGRRRGWGKSHCAGRITWQFHKS